MKIKKTKATDILRFKEVEMREASVEDEIQAVKISGVDQGYDFQLALLAVLCTFDGQKYVMEDLKKLSRADFLQLLKALTGLKQEDLQKMSSDSSGTEDSPTPTSK